MRSTYMYNDKLARNITEGDVIKLYHEDDTFSWWRVYHIVGHSDGFTTLYVEQYLGKNEYGSTIEFTISNDQRFTHRKPVK
jgi:hypothetical protein